MLREGDRVADYEIVARMKAGGMATLYLGRRTGASGFSKPVAIKVVHPHLAEDPTFVTMFVDEALLCARIHHPNVVHVEELRQVDGAHMLVMEYVAGCSLGQLLRALAKRQRRMTPELAVHIAIAVLDGLHAAHELKDDAGQAMEVVHRDVSPDNVLLAWHGHVKLIDFGVAKAMSRQTQTMGSMLKGKVRYMSPEQAFGREVDRRTDVYALGIVLWECLTMRRLFSGGTDFEVLEQVRAPELRPPSTIVSDLPPALDAVLVKALAPNAADRYGSAREMRRALAAAMPTAAGLDGADLAELLRLVMGDEIEAQRAKLASDAESLDVPIVVAEADDEPLRTMTISMAGLASMSGLISAELSATSGTAPIPRPAEVESPSAAKPGRALLWVAGGVLLVAAAAGITLAVTSGAPTPTVTPLAAEVPDALPAVAAAPRELEPSAVPAAVPSAVPAAVPSAVPSEPSLAAGEPVPSETTMSATPRVEGRTETQRASTPRAEPRERASEPAAEASPDVESAAEARPTTRTRPAKMRPAQRELADDFGF